MAIEAENVNESKHGNENKTKDSNWNKKKLGNWTYKMKIVNWS